MGNAKQSAAFKREAEKRKAKRQGVALAVAKKKTPVKKVKKELSPEDKFFREFKKSNPIGEVYFEHYQGPVRLTKIQKCTATTVVVTLVRVEADPTDGTVMQRTTNVTKTNDMRKFDIKRFMKDINALYKKVYLS